MPFDSLGVGAEVMSEIDPLSRMGVTPIPQDVVSAYKREYTAKWKRAHSELAGYPVKWTTNRRGKRRNVATFLANPTANSFFADDRSGTPEPLVALALRVSEEVPGSDFEVDHFWDDPVLQVTYDFCGKRVKACLGIWERDQIKMIASVA